MEKLKSQMTKSEIQINEDKEKFIKDLLKNDKEQIKNTIQKEKTYSLWWRIKKVLGIN